MPFVPEATSVEAKFEGVVDGQQTINDLYFQLPGGYILSDIQSLGTNLSDWFTAGFASHLSEDWSTVAIHIRALNNPASYVVDVSPTPTIGGASAAAEPNNVALCISFRTGLAGRSFRGRNYVPGVPVDQITLNTFDPGWMADVKTTYDLLLPGGGALPGGWIWGVLSRFSGVDVNGKPIPRTTGVFTPIVNTLYTDSTADSMRNRLPGRGK